MKKINKRKSSFIQKINYTMIIIWQLKMLKIELVKIIQKKTFQYLSQEKPSISNAYHLIQCILEFVPMLYIGSANIQKHTINQNQFIALNHIIWMKISLNLGKK